QTPFGVLTRDVSLREGNLPNCSAFTICHAPWMIVPNTGPQAAAELLPYAEILRLARLVSACAKGIIYHFSTPPKMFFSRVVRWGGASIGPYLTTTKRRYC